MLFCDPVIRGFRCLQLYRYFYCHSFTSYEVVEVSMISERANVEETL